MDAHQYFMFIGQTTNADVDAYDSTERSRNRTDRHMDSLVDQCEYLEEVYCGRRHGNSLIGPMASVITTGHVFPYMATTLRDTAISLVNDGFSSMTTKAREEADKWYFSKAKGHFRRSISRCLSDLSGKNIEALRNTTDEYRQAMLPDMDALCASLGIKPIVLKPPSAQQKKAMRRSADFLTKIVGAETVRVFFSGNEVRVAGKNFIYGISKTGGRMGHGSSKLCVYEKSSPDLRLFNLCIYTQGVPLADHVSSIIMSVRAGDEEDILKIGNSYDVWNEQYLKSNYPAESAILFPVISAPFGDDWEEEPFEHRLHRIGANLPPVYRGADRNDRIKKLTGSLFRIVEREMRPEIRAFREEFVLNDRVTPRLIA